MARPRKPQQVDYFPHSCKHGKAMYIVEERYGNDGYAFWFKLKELLGSEDGHILDLTKSDTFEFLQAVSRCSEQKCNDILDLMARLGVIDKPLWDADKVIWSQEFMDDLLYVYSKRGTETPKKPSFRSGNPPQPVVSVTETPQSIVKHSKEKEREEARGNFEPETEGQGRSGVQGSSESVEVAASCLSEHTWEKFKALMPTRNGKFLDEDAVREKWFRSPAIHNQVLAALPNYKRSSEVQDGAVMSPMKFISGRYEMWLTPEEQPLGGGPGPPAAQDRKIDADNLKKEQAEYAARIAAAGTTPLRERIDIACLNQQ